MSGALPPWSDATAPNLLFAFLAFQQGFVDAPILTAAMQIAIRGPTKELGQLLVEQGKLTSRQREILQALAREHLPADAIDMRQFLRARFPEIYCQLMGLDEALSQLTGSESPPGASVPTPTPQSSGSAGPPISGTGLRYRKEDQPHARGGLGAVFKAKDEELNRVVAVKEIRPEFADQAGSRGRFLREAEITGRLEHPGVVPVYSLGQDAAGRPWYAMRFIQGESLKEAIDRFHAAEGPNREPGEQRLALRQLLASFVAVCKTIAYAHSRGILHRDLKPANIMLGKYGETLVVDWGLAKAFTREEHDRLTGEDTLAPTPVQDMEGTRPGQAMGTPSYMSPEQAAGRPEQLGPTTDVYGLGATLYCLLTGRPPVGGTGAADILHQVEQGAISPMRQVKPDVPAALDAICRKALALRQQDRHPTPAALASELEHWLAEETLSPGGRALLAEARERETVARLQAEEQAALAREQRGQAEVERDEARLNLYVANMHLAQQAWNHNHFMRVVELLNQLRPPHPGDKDPRGFEWYYLYRLCQRTVRIIRAHSGGVKAIAFSPDGQHLASAGDDATVRICHVASGQEVRTLHGHASTVWSVAFRPDGGRLASADANGKIIVWDAVTWRVVFSFQGQGLGICSITFAPDGQRLAASGLDRRLPDEAGEVRIWDADTGNQLLSLRQRLSAWCVAFSPNGRLIASGDFDTVRLWDSATGNLVHAFKEEQVPVHGVAFTPDGRRLLSAIGGVLKMRDSELGTEVWSSVVTSGLTSVVCSPDGKWIASGDLDGTVRIHAPDTGKQTHLCKGHAGQVVGLAPSPDGQRLASAGDDQTVRLWAAARIEESYRHPFGRKCVLQFSRYGERVLFWSESALEIWQTAAWRRLFGMSLQSDGEPRVVLTDDGSQVALDDLRGSVRLVDISGSSQKIPAADGSPPVSALAFSPTKSLLAVGDFEGTIRVLDLTLSHDIFLWKGLMSFARTTIPELGEKLALCDTAGSAQHEAFVGAMAALRWHMQQAKGPDSVVGRWELLPSRGHRGHVVGLAFSPDGRHLAAVDFEGTLTVWALHNGVRTFDSEGHRKYFGRGLTFSPDGRRLLAVSEDHTVRVCSLDSGAALYTLSGHLGPVHAVAASKDGLRYLTGGADGLVKLWETATGKQVFSFDKHSAAVQSVAFGADGRRLLSADQDGTVMIWEVDLSYT
jgi:WD40 repeat protein/serine/threonine protein kinase